MNTSRGTDPFEHSETKMLRTLAIVLIVALTASGHGTRPVRLDNDAAVAMVG